MKLIQLQCPNCGSTLEVEEGRETLFCQYCGTKILLDDGAKRFTINQNINASINHTVRHIDEARIAEETTKQERIAYKREELKKKRGLGYWLTLPFKIIGFLITFFVIVLIILSIRNDLENKKIEAYKADMEAKGYIAVAENSLSFLRDDYRAVISQLEGNGFTNIEAIDLDSIGGPGNWKDGQVDEVTIAGDSSFYKGDYFEPNAKVVVTYH